MGNKYHTTFAVVLILLCCDVRGACDDSTFWFASLYWLRSSNVCANVTIYGMPKNEPAQRIGYQEVDTALNINPAHNYLGEHTYIKNMVATKKWTWLKLVLV